MCVRFMFYSRSIATKCSPLYHIISCDKIIRTITTNLSFHNFWRTDAPEGNLTSKRYDYRINTCKVYVYDIPLNSTLCTDKSNGNRAREKQYFVQSIRVTGRMQRVKLFDASEIMRGNDNRMSNEII